MKPLWQAHLSQAPEHAGLGLVHMGLVANTRRNPGVHLHMQDAIPLLADLALCVNTYAQQTALLNTGDQQINGLHAMCTDDCDGTHAGPAIQLAGAILQLQEALDYAGTLRAAYLAATTGQEAT